MSDKLNFIIEIAFLIVNLSFVQFTLSAFYASKCRIDFYNTKEIVKKISNYFTIWFFDRTLSYYLYALYIYKVWVEFFWRY